MFPLPVPFSASPPEETRRLMRIPTDFSFLLALSRRDRAMSSV